MNSEPVDALKYRRIIGKLIYLIVIRPDIAYSVGVVSQFMQKPDIQKTWEHTNIGIC